MEHPFFNRLGRVLWVAIVLLIVMLAFYVSVGRMLVANMSGYSTEILQELNARLPFTLEAEGLSGEWHSFTPVIALTNLRLHVPGSSGAPLELSQGRIGVDVLNSLRTGSLQLTRLVLGGLNLHGTLRSNGTLALSAFGDGSGELADPLREFLLNVEHVTLHNNRLFLTMPSGEQRELELDLQLSRDGSQRHVEATLTSTAGARITVIAQGLGDPFRPEQFTGQAYLHIESTDLGAMQDMFADQSPAVWARGGADLQLWWDWDKGHSALAMQFEGHDLTVSARDANWQVPLQRVAFASRLLRNNDDWTVFIENLQVHGDTDSVNVPRLQLDNREGGLRLRTSAVSLAPIISLLAHQEAVPQGLREVFVVLQPKGELSALQLNIGTVENPFANWEVQANFADVAAQSWHGAPGIGAAAGYVRFSPGTGYVVLDSPGLSLDFPTIYRQPLHYEDMSGSLKLNWDSATFRIASGLLTTLGEEGAAKVLFGLTIPLQPNETGIEMDLLVGLHDSQPVHRVKYIPYVLDDALVSWLAHSIGEGRIEQGAFLWRGSLKADASALRTVQLAFNITDTQLSYHPHWPPLLVQQGIVLIDDSHVSVWADRAGLFESVARQLSVETRMNAKGEITLDLHGTVHGPAYDGFRVLNESPLAEVVGTSFGAWTAKGVLDTDLDLHLNLTDVAAAPQVAVDTQWHDVDLVVMPGNLSVNAVNGQFTYSTTSGFSSNDLKGELWGNAINATLRQQFATDTDHYDPASTVVHIDLATSVDTAELWRWLQLDSLSFISGKAAAVADIQLAPGAVPVLSVTSDLQGVGLDLPQPWHKDAQSSLPLYLQLPLQPGVMPLQIDLAQQLAIDLDIAGGVVSGGALGINAVPASVRQGELHVTGHAPLIRVEDWLDFVSRYYGGEVLQTLASGSDADANLATATDEDNPGSVPLAYFVDELHTDALVVLQQPLHDVTLNAALKPTQWKLSLAADWVTAALTLPRNGRSSMLEISHMDIDQLPDFQLHGDGENTSWNLPMIDVSIDNLYQAKQRLGELRFSLSGADDVFAAHNITGELASLQLRPESPAQMLWHHGATAYTEIQADFDFTDLGQTLEYFDYQRILETERGELGVQLRWPGGPQAFSLAQAEGSIQVDIGKGSFLDAPPGATGALRVVSILNLADIVRRLSLTTMFESGIPFDTVEGTIELHDGLLKVERMDVKGGSSFQFSGESDVQTKNIAGELVATLPVARNLPWIAALAASLPVAAGVFVISQVFDQQMSRLSSAVYTISGSWNDPEVDFDRIFDNTPASTEPDQPVSP
ncbi:MAG: DUF3971 domain-containing protein [Halioglobus sp.]